MQDREPAGLNGGPAVADIDADIVARRHLPAELAIDVVVIVQVRQQRHGGRRYSVNAARSSRTPYPFLSSGSARISVQYTLYLDCGV